MKRVQKIMDSREVNALNALKRLIRNNSIMIQSESNAVTGVNTS